MAARMENTPEFAALSEFVSAISSLCSDDNYHEYFLSIEQASQLHILVNNMISKIKSTQKSTELSRQASVFSTISYALFLLAKNSEIVFEHQRKTQEFDETNEDEGQLLDRICENLDIKGFNDESELIDIIVRKVNKSKKLTQEIISHFNLPKKTKSSNIIKELGAKIKEEISMHVGIKEELVDANENLNLVKKDLEILQKCVAKKDDKIQKLKNERDEAKEQLKEALEELENRNNNSIENKLTTSEENKECDLIGAQIESIKSQLLAADIDLKRKNRKIENKKIETLEEQLGEAMEENDILVSMNQQLNHKLSLAQIQNEKEETKEKTIDTNSEENNELSKLKSCLEASETENDRSKKILTEILSQFEKQSEELIFESNGRVTLTESVQKLLYSNQILESQLEITLKQKNDLNAQLDIAALQRKQQLQFDQPALKQIYDNNTLRQLQQITEKVLPEKAEEILKIMEDNKIENPEKVIFLYNYTISQLVEKRQNEDLTEKLIAEKVFSTRMYNSALGQLRFITDLSESRAIQNWIVGDENKEWSRTSLQIMAARMESFFAQNRKEIEQKSSIPESDIFKTFLPNSEIDQKVPLSTRISEFLGTFSVSSQLKSNTEKELYLMLIQSLVANDVLQKFSLEAKIRYDDQINELKKMRDSFEMQVDHQKDAENVVALVENIKNILRKAILNGKDLNSCLECIEMASRVNLDPTKYIRKLERRLARQTDEKEDITQKLNITIRETTSQLNEITVEMNNLKEEYQQKIFGNEKEMKSLRETIEKKDDEIQSLIQNPQADKKTTRKQVSFAAPAIKIKNNDNENENDINNENNVKNHVSKELEERLKRDFDETAAKYEEIVDELKDEVNLMEQKIEETVEDSRNKINSIKEKSKKKQIKLVKIVNTLRKNLSETEKKLNQEIQAITKEKEKSEEIEQDLIKQNESLTNENNDLKKQKQTLEVENKIMKSRLKSQEEKMSREKSLFESQMKLKIFAIESESKSQIEKSKSEQEVSKQELFTFVCRLFKEMVDINQPINEETVFSLLQTVKAKLNRLDRSSFAAEAAIRELEEVRLAVGDPSTTNINGSSSGMSNSPSSSCMKASSLVKNLKENNNQLLAKIKELEKEAIKMKGEIASMKRLQDNATQVADWIEWSNRMQKLVINDGFEIISTPAEVRSRLEEAIFMSVDKKRILRKIEILRAEKKLLLSPKRNYLLSRYFSNSSSSFSSQSNGQESSLSKKKMSKKYGNDRSNDANTGNNDHQNNGTSLTHLMTIVIIVRRLEKMSGLVQNYLSLRPKPVSTNKIKNENEIANNPNNANDNTNFNGIFRKEGSSRNNMNGIFPSFQIPLVPISSVQQQRQNMQNSKISKNLDNNFDPDTNNIGINDNQRKDGESENPVSNQKIPLFSKFVVRPVGL